MDNIFVKQNNDQMSRQEQHIGKQNNDQVPSGTTYR